MQLDSYIENKDKSIFVDFIEEDTRRMTHGGKIKSHGETAGNVKTNIYNRVFFVRYVGMIFRRERWKDGQDGPGNEGISKHEMKSEEGQ